MSIFVDVDYASLNKYNEELCGDKVEIIRGDKSVIIVLADGLGSGVKANILATLTSKIIGTMLSEGASIDDAVETITDTLPVCKERNLAYSTFSILQIFENGNAYLIEFDNPVVIRLIKGKFSDIERESRVINGRLIKESRFIVAPEDVLMMISDGVIHAGVGECLNLGWQWKNVKDYVEKIYKKNISAKKISIQLLQVCNNLYADKPGDDTTVVTARIKKRQQVNVIIGPPLDRNLDRFVVDKFMSGEGKKVVCGGTTSQIVSKILGKEIITSFDYVDSKLPPIAKIEGIDLTTEGVLTMGKALEYVQSYLSPENTFKNFVDLDKLDGASRLAKFLIDESTAVNFFVGRACNYTHQEPDFPINTSIKLKLVYDISKCLKKLGKTVEVEYF